MFKNLLKTAFRNITHKFGYSFLNILGMTLGITSALFLILYVSDELSFDRYHELGDRIYRVQSHITETDDEFTYKTIEGSTEEALDLPNSIVLTETLAGRYFSKESALGKTLKVGEVAGDV